MPMSQQAGGAQPREQDTGIAGSSAVPRNRPTGQRPTDEIFTAFYRQTYAAAVSFVLGRTNDCDAEALVAEAYILLWHRYLQTEELDKGWLYGILRNKVGDHYRRQAVRHSVHEQLASQEEVATSTLDHTTATEQQLDVERALKLLPPEQAEVLLLAYWSDLTTAEGARALNLNPVTYRVRLNRARNAFRNALETAQRYGPDRGLES